MKTQNVDAIFDTKNTFSVSKKKSKPALEKFMEWFRNFLENSK